MKTTLNNISKIESKTLGTYLYSPRVSSALASHAMEQELNTSIPGSNPCPLIKLTIFAPSGKENATYSFPTLSHVRDFLHLNDIPRYQIWS
jgi:hypothetical protein